MAKGRKPKGWFAAAAGAIAAVALVATNLDTILSTAAKWLGPYLSPRAEIAVVLDPDLAVAADVFVADPANETRAIAVGQARREQRAVLSVPADTVYTIGWQGAGLEAGAATRVLAVKGGSSFRLVRAGGAPDQIKLALRQSDAGRPEIAAVEPSAKLLLSARAVQAAGEPSTAVAAGALPALDRAAAIVGLFETGTTDCARRLFYVPAIGGEPGAKTPAVGCLGASIPGWLAEVIDALDDGEAHQLDRLLGDAAASLRSFARDRRAAPPEATLRQAMDRLLAAPEFWITYQRRVLDAYAQATETARQIGLTSERGRLLLFDQLVFAGPGGIARAARSYAERYPPGAAGRPDTERARIGAMGEILKAGSHGPPAALSARRIDTIVSGRGTIRGIAFDLNQLGVSDADEARQGAAR